MADRYLFGHRGEVEEVKLPGKAIISFTHNGQHHRALLWIKGYFYQGKNLEVNDSFSGKLNAGDNVCFDCHIYDRKESRDNCGWYAAKCWKDIPGEVMVSGMSRVTNQTGYIFELDSGKGVIQFEVNEEEQRVFFLKSKFYHFGKRPGNKHQLSEFLSGDDPVQFDAEKCAVTAENKMCNWFASMVWKGKKPTSGTGTSNGWGYSGAMGDEIVEEDSVSNTGREVEEDGEFPALLLPPGLTDRHGYKVFETGGTSREGKGSVLTLINEECGIALWMIRQNTWETVFFHRRNSFLVDTSLSKYDLQESLIPGTSLDICAVQAVPDFPCRWIARKAVANC